METNDEIVIYVKPEEVWDYYVCNISNLSDNMVEIAYNDVFNTAVYITDDDGILWIYVDHNGETVESRMCIDEELAVNNLSEIYDLYINTEPDDDIFKNDMIDCREDDLYYAFMKFMEVVIETDEPLYKKENQKKILNMMNHIIEFISKENGFKVYRPMFIVDDNGNKEFIEYPYEVNAQ